MDRGDRHLAVDKFALNKASSFAKGHDKHRSRNIAATPLVQLVYYEMVREPPIVRRRDQSSAIRRLYLHLTHTYISPAISPHGQQ